MASRWWWWWWWRWVSDQISVFSELPYLDNIPQAIPREAEALFAEFAQFQPFYAQQALICREPQHVNF